MTVLIYDGECPFCEGWVRRLALGDRRGELRFATRGTRFASELFDRFPHLRSVESLILVAPDGRVFTRSDAALRSAIRAGGAYRLAALGLLAPRRLRDAVYDAIAKRRRRLSRGRCGIGPGMAEVKQRLLT